MSFRCWILIIALLFSLHPLRAGNTGKIAGKVIDAKSKEPLVGANVVIPGTVLGAATNIDGNYTILNVQPGVYNLRASLLGYDPVTVDGIRVSIDLTTSQDFQLNETVVEQKEVVITAERPLVQKDLTATTAIVGRDEIAALPVTEVSQVLNLQAGFVAGSLRGGRSGEVAYWIDGVPVTDAFDGSQVVEVNKNLVQEMQLVSGAFNAEYGQAMSGIVNIATREGESKFHGGLGVYGGQYATSTGANVDAQGNTISQLFPGITKFQPTTIRNIEGNLSGPVVGDNLTFFANARYIYFGGDLYGIRRFNPQNIAYADSTGAFHLYRDPAGRGDSVYVPMNWSERKYAQGKLTWRISPVLKLSGNYIYDDTKAKAYDRAYFLNPDGKGDNYNLSNTVIFQLTHTLNATTFYTLGGSFFDKDFKYYLYEDPHDPRYVDPLVQSSNPEAFSFLTGGTDLNRSHHSTETKLLKLDISSQVNQQNLVKGGVEVRSHRIFLENISLRPSDATPAFAAATSDPYIQTTIQPLSSPYHDMYTHKPLEFSGYIQDKVEFSDFIMNIGVRFDYFQPDGRVLNDAHSDPNDPLHYMYTVDDPNIYDPIRLEHRSDDLATRASYWYKKAAAKSQISPRIGASFPITATGVVHFSYGHFFQTPRFERLYENPDFKIGSGTGNQGLLGNADLKPEETINGEIGVQQQLAEDLSMDLTAYIRDIRNLTSSNDEVLVFGGSAKYSQYENIDFGDAKGIVLTLNKRFGSNVSTTLDYTFQVARGTASDPTQRLWIGKARPDLQLVPLDWDQRHTLNATLSFDSKPWGFSFIGQYGSGTPYTPRNTTDISTILTNSQLKPSFFNLDGRAYYELPFEPYRFTLFARVFNLLDIRNETSVFDVTGRADFTTDEASAYSSNPRQDVNTVDQFFRYPTNFSEPRRVEVGLNMEF